ncbi:VacJ family lipoprotein [Neomegalonema sp.]|uniref:MlaA family lipoprotein n=1 Tax=Neomegalonema sp. TaxID=2039713 RepID=UPI00261F76EF|nr:VacJ family lipoprotein [Neomegalonema sp.]MDD2869464.1 VacJ family lipoprotein [Neomegalonema sp.]
MRKAAIVLAATAGLTACASGGARTEGATAAGDGLIADPFEPANRAVHGFNKAADRFALRPAAQVYDAATPALVKHLAGNAVGHLAVPAQAVQGVLRGDLRSAATSVGRFAVNTVVGAGGLLDPATEVGLPAQPEDFGRTLASWGVGEGPYVELPLLGPSTARDAVGRLGGVALDPVSWAAPAAHAEWVPPAASVTGAVDWRAQNMATVDTALYGSADSYAIAKSVWLQQRRALIAGGDPTAAPSAPDIYEDEPF